MKRDLQWTPIEELDEAGVPKAVHIMPVVMTPDFATEQEARDFAKAVDAASGPCLTDENDCIVCTYFGHTVAADCPCSPEFRDGIVPAYFHRVTQ